MSKRSTVITLALLIVVMPFLGFPGGVKSAIYVLIGGLIAATEYMVRGERRTENTGPASKRPHRDGDRPLSGGDPARSSGHQDNMHTP